MSKLKLSVLDQSPIHDGKSPKEGLFDTISLAQECEALGYHRYWLSEHHDTAGYASSSPEIMISAVANATKTIRVGSGGVMLNHYNSFKVAETFNTLRALYGDRIDLGIGRASGASYIVTQALTSSNTNDYAQKAYTLINCLDKTIPADDYFYKFELTPKDIASVPVFLLGSSSGSSKLAGDLGAGFCLALFIGTHDRPVEIISDYKDHFKKSVNFEKPDAKIAVACICSSSKEDAENIASSHAYWKVQAFRHSVRSGLQSPELVKKLVENLSISDRDYYEETMNTMVLGTPKKCKEKIEFLASKYGVEEVVVVNVTYSFKDRQQSYKLLANEFNLNNKKE